MREINQKVHGFQWNKFDLREKRAEAMLATIVEI
jgi:hypothetical protein